MKVSMATYYAAAVCKQMVWVSCRHCPQAGNSMGVRQSDMQEHTMQQQLTMGTVLPSASAALKTFESLSEAAGLLAASAAVSSSACTACCARASMAVISELSRMTSCCCWRTLSLVLGAAAFKLIAAVRTDSLLLRKGCRTAALEHRHVMLSTR